ncbi:LITAF [Branchiostoma lanceolatum]|uniref:LITAF protein n=2 Tax=Branchiostoma lanceolatum TaxID=7740 RepID=A0A8J9ZIE3_BRALA|nr:LITAF [Branchiostoma lanceolatum]
MTSVSQYYSSRQSSTHNQALQFLTQTAGFPQISTMAQTASVPYPVAASTVTQVTVFSQDAQLNTPPVPPNLPVSGPEEEFGDAPVVMMCPHCRIRIVTSLKYVRGPMVYATSMFLLLSIIPWVLCGCFIPLCLRSMKDVEHSCPNCGSKLGTYKRLK